MSSQTAMSLMTVAEFGLWAALGLLFWKRGLVRRFPAMGAYLALRVLSMPVLLVFFEGQSRHWFQDHADVYYFYSYWAVYAASAITLFFVCQEVFRSALAAFAGLQKVGTVLFRWVAFISTLVSLSTLPLSHIGVFIIPEIAYRLMRSISILELCLLAFMCLSMNALRLSMRDMAFGISMGLGLMSSSDFVLASLWTRTTGMTAPLQFVSEGVILGALVAWMGWAWVPAAVRQPVTIPATSMLFRWNEIASALGHTGTQVAVQQPASGFFLSDVEKVVDEVLTRNLKGRESET